MSQDKASLSIKLLNKEYLIACRDHERAALLESADFLNEQMEALKLVHRIAPVERLALMVALNLSNEILHKRSAGEDSRVLDKIRALCDRVESVIDASLSVEV